MVGSDDFPFKVVPENRASIREFSGKHPQLWKKNTTETWGSNPPCKAEGKSMTFDLLIILEKHMFFTIKIPRIQNLLRFYSGGVVG